MLLGPYPPTRYQHHNTVRCRGGNRYVEGDLLTFGYLMLDDSLGYPYFRLFNGNPYNSKSEFPINTKNVRGLKNSKIWFSINTNNPRDVKFVPKVSTPFQTYFWFSTIYLCFNISKKWLSENTKIPRDVKQTLKTLGDTNLFVVWVSQNKFKK